MAGEVTAEERHEASCACGLQGSYPQEGTDARKYFDLLVLERRKVRVLEAERDTPHTRDFLEAVKLEALHQRERWGAEHDAGKEPSDWFWLLGYLSGKALAAAVKGDTAKALHHTISSGAVLLNWHAHMTGESTAMRPGIEPPDATKDGSDE